MEMKLEDAKKFMEARNSAQELAVSQDVDKYLITRFVMRELGFKDKKEYHEYCDAAYDAIRLDRYNRAKEMLNNGKSLEEVAAELNIDENLVEAIVKVEDTNRAEKWIDNYADIHKKARSEGVNESDFEDYAIKELGYESKVAFRKDLNTNARLVTQRIKERVTRFWKYGFRIDKIVEITGYGVDAVRKVVNEIEEKKEED